MDDIIERLSEIKDKEEILKIIDKLISIESPITINILNSIDKPYIGIDWYLDLLGLDRKYKPKM